MKKAKIVILAGQSNAVGVGFRKYLPDHFSNETVEEYNNGYENIPINYFSHDKKSDGFVKTGVNCTEISKDTIGPELSMAEYFSKEYTNENIFIVKCAYGGTNLNDEWCSPSSKTICTPEETEICSINGERKTGWCYNNLIKILRESIEILESKGYEPLVYGFCWMQGESDAFSIETVNKYAWMYQNLLNDVKNEFSGYFAPDCTFVDAGISEIWPLYREMNEVKKHLAKENENFRFIDTIAEGLTTTNEPHEEPDTYHYDVDSVIKLGRLFAQNINF